MTGMKALSLRQPWANAVLFLDKHIENRKWNTKFRGEFLIHAAKGMTQLEHVNAVVFCEDVLELQYTSKVTQALRLSALNFGGIVGKARLVDVVPPRDEFVPAGVETHYPSTVREWRWHMREQFGFVLADITPLPFVPCKGALGLWEVPEDVLEQVDASGKAAQ